MEIRVIQRFFLQEGEGRWREPTLFLHFQLYFNDNKNKAEKKEY